MLNFFIYMSKFTQNRETPPDAKREELLIVAREKSLLALANEEANSVHPEDTPASLACLISRELIEDEPVITPSGYIYSKENITRWLKEGNETDPGNRKPLSEKDLKPFEQLKPLLEKFSLRRINYNQRREELLEKAMDTVRAAKRAVRPILEDPPLFTCPISKQRIQEPILTPEGKIYDKESLINNGYKDENGQQLDKNNCRYFEEFQSYLNTYNFYLDLNFSKRTTPVF